MSYKLSAWAESFVDDAAVVILSEALGGSEPSSARTALNLASENIAQRFHAGESVTYLVHLRAAVIDLLLIHLWRTHANYCAEVASLVAVGGYGRAELHPYSDVDILLLLPEDLPGSVEPELS
ncbi:MAG: hypothetical protein GWP02_05165, partial [Desulfobulbaceae bacterium]|nr:hypothetical protein [Desulfobulbaceae bacterium]